MKILKNKMKHITILGAGLLIGTALAVIIPEGIHTLYANHPRQHNDLEFKSMAL
jgi:zinc transporter 9